MVLVGNGNDRNDDSGGSRVEYEFQRRSDTSPTGWLVVRVIQNNGQGGHHQRLHWSHPMIVLWKKCDRAWTMTELDISQ